MGKWVGAGDALANRGGWISSMRLSPSASEKSGCFFLHRLRSLTREVFTIAREACLGRLSIVTGLNLA